MAPLRPLLLAGIASFALALPLAAAQPAVAQTKVASAGIGATRIIGEREIGHRIADMVKQRNGGRPVEIHFHGMGNEIAVPAGNSAFQVDEFSYDTRSGRFYATVASSADNIKVSGRAQAVEAIPVLKNRIASGQVISRGDIEWLQVPANRYGAGYIDRIEELVGQTPRRALAAGMPIRNADIGKPEAISKNGLVTMVAQAPGLTITTTGRAMENGSIGDVVQVMNLQSKRTVQATVTGINLVQVITAPSIIASN
jgi:flagella basal body P-ring formation protein FlgA